MKKEIREVRDGMLHVTIADERWYIRDTFDSVTGLPSGKEYVPSVTWITGHYPKGVGFYKWLAQKGWDEAEAIKSAAGDKGSKVHQGIVHLIDGLPIKMDDAITNPSTGLPEPLTLEEYDCLLAFRGWWAESQPETQLRERVVWNDAYGYAGTLDWFGRLTGKGLDGLWLLDWKTGQDVWPEHELQVSAYKAALESMGVLKTDEPVRLGLLQIGYRRNKRRWKLTEVIDQFDLFLAARRIWQKEAAGAEVFRAEYPLEIVLGAAPPAPTIVVPNTPKRKRRQDHPDVESMVQSLNDSAPPLVLEPS